MALSLEDLYRRKAAQRQAQRGLLGAPFSTQATQGITVPDNNAQEVPKLDLSNATANVPNMTGNQIVVPGFMNAGGSRTLDINPEVLKMMEGQGATPPQQEAPETPAPNASSTFMGLLGSARGASRPASPPATETPTPDDVVRPPPPKTPTVETDRPPATASSSLLPNETQVPLNENEVRFNNLLDTITATTATPASTASTTEAEPDTSAGDSASTAANDTLLANVNSLYQEYLGRNGNPDNMQYWADQLADGASITDVANAIASSPEGQDFAAAQDVFVDNDPVSDLVGGDTDSGGQTDSSGGQTGGSGGETAAPAVTAADVQGLYQRLLSRQGADNFVQAWVDSGQSLADIELAIRQSPEFLAREDNAPVADFNEDSARAEVTAAYQDLLGRAPLEAGLNYWVGTMSEGTTLPQVLFNIRQSPEFGGRITNAVEGFFQQYVERGASSEESNSFLERAKGGMTLAQIEEEIKALGNSDTGGSDTGVPQAPTPTPTPVGSQSDVQQAINETQTYEAETADPSGSAEAISAATPDREVQPGETVQYQLAQILDSNSPLMQRARTQGLQFANRRGLLNSSIGAEAAQAAMLDQALPIAQQDARTFAEAAAQTTDLEGRAGLQDAALGTDVSKFNVSETGVTNRFNATSLNEAGAFNASQANASIQNFLQREAARLLQDDQQLFTAEQNAADRELRNYLQERQFDFQGSENALDRDLQFKLQENDQVFKSSESQLDRSFQSTERGLDRSFQAGESALDRSLTATEGAANRALQSMLQTDRIAFETWSQENSQLWNAAQNELQREFDRYRVDAQTASTVMYSTMESIASIYADPNLTVAQKQNAIRNVMDSANAMPALVNQISAGMNRDTQNTLPDGAEATVYTNPEALLGNAYDPEANYWIGPYGRQYGQQSHPSWIIPPAQDSQQAQVIEQIVNPETGQIFIAPSAGYRLREADDDFTDPGGGDPNTGAGGNYTGDPANLTYVGGNGFLTNVYVDSATGKRYMLVNGDYVPFEMPETQGGGGR